MELFELSKVSEKSKVLLLKELGFNSDGDFVIDSTGEKVIDKYVNMPVKISNMLILPGSTIILDNNPVSIASYMQENKDVI